MTTTVTFSPTELKEVIRLALLQQGLELQGQIIINIHQGSIDPREPSAPGLESITAKVAPVRQSSVPANLLRDY